MYNYLVDVSKCETEEELHRVLRDSLEFPDFYGMNLDAFWDCITGFMGVPATITLRGVSRADKEIQEELRHVLRIIERAIKMYGEIVLLLEE